MKILYLILSITLTSASFSFAAKPAKQPPKAEAKFIPEMTYRSWEQKYQVLKKQVEKLNGSKPIREIRKQIEKELKQTQKLMKTLNRIDARKPIDEEDRQTYLDDTSSIINRLEALTQNLTLATVPSDIPTKKNEKWTASRKDVIEQLKQVSKTLEDTEKSLKKLKTTP